MARSAYTKAFANQKGLAATTIRPTIWDGRHHTNLVRIASSLRADMIFGKDSGGAARLMRNQRIGHGR